MRRFLCFILLIGLAFSLYGCSSPLEELVESYHQENNSEIGLPEEIANLNSAFEKTPTNGEVVSELIALHKERGDYKACVDVYEEYLQHVTDPDASIDLAYCLMELGQNDKALITCEESIKSNANAEIFNALGNVYGNLTEYQKALEAYKKASAMDSTFKPSRTNTLWALFNSNQYEKCIEEAQNQANNGFECYDLYYYIGGSYEALNKFPEAKRAYERALEFEVDDYSDTYYHLGIMAFTEEEYVNAAEFAKTALIHNPQNQDAIWLSNEIENLSRPLHERLVGIIEEQYLYKYDHEKFNNHLYFLKGAANSTVSSIVEYAKQTLLPQDAFSFFITGKDYDAYLAEQESPTVTYTRKKANGFEYEHFRIDFFTPMTGKEFIKRAEQIENPEKRILVFDLRGNNGGDMKAASEILDYLLGDCATVNFINRDGYNQSYYSNADKVEFKKIIILTDGYTASAAELLTLGLKVYYPGTLLLGDRTYGKGVSQIVWNDKDNRLALLLVNAYWNVREINIHGYGILPDVEAKTPNEIDSALQNALSMIQ